MNYPPPDDAGRAAWVVATRPPGTAPGRRSTLVVWAVSAADAVRAVVDPRAETRAVTTAHRATVDDLSPRRPTPLVRTRDLRDADFPLGDGRPVAWMDDALCARYDRDWWTAPPREAPTAAETRIAAARWVCDRCPVQAPCLDRALAHGDRHTIAAGLTWDERARVGRHAVA